jgi:hypothetical protein
MYMLADQKREGTDVSRFCTGSFDVSGLSLAPAFSCGCVDLHVSMCITAKLHVLGVKAWGYWWVRLAGQVFTKQVRWNTCMPQHAPKMFCLPRVRFVSVVRVWFMEDVVKCWFLCGSASDGLLAMLFVTPSLAYHTIPGFMPSFYKK